MIKKYLLPIALFIGVVWDVLFWEKAPGVSFPIFIALCLAAAYFLLRSEDILPAKTNILLIGLVMLLAIFTFVRKDPATDLLSYGLTLLLVLMLAGTYRSGAWVNFNLYKYIQEGFSILAGLIILPLKFFSEMKSSNGEDSAQNGRLIPQILRGLLLAVPVVIVFTFLLSSADMVFSQSVENLLRSFRIDNIGKYIVQGILILMVAYFMIGLVKYAETRGPESDPDVKKGSGVRPFLGFTEGATVLIVVMILFGLFVIVQFRYFFSGELNIHETGFTYSEYARRGFSELIWVAIFCLLMIQVLRTVLKIETTKQRKLLVVLTVGLVLLTLIILASSFKRLSLYESAYGFSRLRTYSHIFILWLGLLLVSAAVLEFVDRPRFFANAVLAASVGFVITLAFLNVDAFIVRQNVKQADQGMQLDANYLVSLSSDAVPRLAEEYNTTEHSDDIRNDIGAILACQNNRLAMADSRNWASFHFADWKARNALNTIQNELTQYKVRSDDYGFTVVGPNGHELDCQPNAGYD